MFWISKYVFEAGHVTTCSICWKLYTLSHEGYLHVFVSFTGMYFFNALRLHRFKVVQSDRASDVPNSASCRSSSVYFVYGNTCGCFKALSHVHCYMTPLPSPKTTVYQNKHFTAIQQRKHEAHSGTTIEVPPKQPPHIRWHAK